MIIFTRTLLNRRFGPHAEHVLSGNLRRLPKEKKGSMTKFEWIATPVQPELPTKEEFSVLLAKTFTSTIESLVDDAFSEFESLAEELDDWYNNLPESFQSGDKGSELEEARYTLQNLSRPDVPESVAKMEIIFIPAVKTDSQSARCSNAAASLQAAVEAINDHIDDQRKALGDEFKDEEGLGDLADELDSAAQEADGVSFPGMY